MGLVHARDVIFGISNCKYCENFKLKTLHARLTVFDRESDVLPRRATPEASVLREAAAWSLEAELEAMESEQFSLSLPPSPGRHHANSLVLHPARRHGMLFPLGWRIFYIPRPPTLSTSPAYTELVEVLACDIEKLSLDWPDEPRESQSSKLDERFLSGSGSRPTRRKLPFFPDLHHEVSRSWKQPFSSCLTNAAAADFTNLVDSVEQGFATVPAVEDMLAAHLLPNSAPSWKSIPLLPSKPCRTTSALISKSYMAVGQAGAALHTMPSFRPTKRRY